ncbi:MAG: guanylate kinase [Candidatus Kapaibacteriota bacterium]
MKAKKQLIVLSAPSGAGKTTLARYLLSRFPQLKFSVSATTRKPRENEIDGKDYYFLSEEKFKELIENGDLIEYEQIFGNYYGTLRSEVDASLARGETIIFDIDVKGALSIKELYPENAYLIFIAPPSLDKLKERLIQRGTETPEQLQKRFQRIEMEMKMQDKFNYVLVNDDLVKAGEELVNLVKKVSDIL